MAPKDDDALLRQVVTHMDELAAQRRKLDEKITALGMTYEVLTGREYTNGTNGHAPTVGAKRPADKIRITNALRTKRHSSRAPSGITRDKQAPEKTLAFLQDRKRPTTVTAVARHFRIDEAAASSRLRRLVNIGWAVRASKGHYEPAIRETEQQASA